MLVARNGDYSGFLKIPAREKNSHLTDVWHFFYFAIIEISGHL